MAKISRLESYFNESNDRERGLAVRLSKQHWIWHLVTLDGDKWTTYAHKPEKFIQCVTFIDGKFSEITTSELLREAPTRDSVGLTYNVKAQPEHSFIMADLAKAVKWLQNHSQTILGTTDNGVCVLEQGTRMLASGEVVGNDTTVWLPANINVLRDWMGY